MQEIIVTIVLLAVLAIIVKNVYRMLTGKKSGCNSCPKGDCCECGKRKK